MADAAPASLNILHIMRAPLGGLFRHVVDLACGQSERGHRVGIVADSTGGGARADAILDELGRTLAYGVTRVPMSRQIGPSDVAAVNHVSARAAEVGADVLHGHGAKGGAYARLARHVGAIRAYTPHGGSLHYRWGTPAGFLYLAAERALMRRTDLFLFESAYGRDAFRAKVGDPGVRARVVHNGVAAAEFEPVAGDATASDIVFVGELRVLKGVDVLLRAVAGSGISVAVVGDGPDRAAFEADAAALGLNGQVHFVGAKAARDGFTLGRVLVVPSRAESLPYIVLEAAAAGVPLIATAVGGMAEIFGSNADKLVPPDDASALRRAIETTLREPEAARQTAQRLQARVRAAFSVGSMTDAVITAYADALRQRQQRA